MLITFNSRIKILRHLLSFSPATSQVGDVINFIPVSFSGKTEKEIIFLSFAGISKA
jgi:hypothetical protein